MERADVFAGDGAAFSRGVICNRLTLRISRPKRDLAGCGKLQLGICTPGLKNGRAGRLLCMSPRNVQRLWETCIKTNGGLSAASSRNRSGTSGPIAVILEHGSEGPRMFAKEALGLAKVDCVTEPYGTMREDF